MNCKFILKNLIDITEKKLPSEKQKLIDIHLQSCNRCAALVERFAQVWQRWEHPAQAELSPDFGRLLQQRIRKYEKRTFTIPNFGVGWEPWLRPIAAVGILLIGMLLGCYLGNFPMRNTTEISQQQLNLATEQFFDYHLESLDDFPNGSVGEFYFNLGQNQ